MKVCKYCGQQIEYTASSLRGAWYARNGRICEVASEEFDGAIAHTPGVDADSTAFLTNY
jgi:hypothetical protein